MHFQIIIVNNEADEITAHFAAGEREASVFAGFEN
jgi:hypothetical protein